MNKIQTKNYIRENIIKKYKPWVELSKEDLYFMLEVLQDHENADEKIGLGVKGMWLEESSYGQKHFMLERIDGTREDFSFLKCFTKSSPKSNYLKACRKAVENIIISFRNIVFGENETIICPIMNIPITKHQSHVDHDLPYPYAKLRVISAEANQKIKKEKW
jgi:hypothetical protein